VSLNKRQKKKDNYMHSYLMITKANLRPGMLHCHEREGAKQRQRFDRRVGEKEIIVEELRQFMLGEESGSLRYTVPTLCTLVILMRIV
jgi:hypothetical protein